MTTITTDGEKLCSKAWIAESSLDTLVLEQVRDQVLSQGRLTELLRRLRDREILAREHDSGRVPELRARIAAAEDAMSSLITIAKTVPSLNGQRPYQTQLSAVSMELRTANVMLEDVLRRSSELAGEITPERVDLFRQAMLEILFGENRAVAKVYLLTIVSSVIVGKKHIDIQGHISNLALGVDHAAREQLDSLVPGVRRYERRWRRRWDSNPRYPSGYTPLAGERLRPLGHLSVTRCISQAGRRYQALCVIQLSFSHAMRLASAVSRQQLSHCRQMGRK